MPGVQTVCLPLRIPATASSPTTRGVVANGADFMPRVIRVCTKPGRITVTRTPEPASESPSPWANASRPAFDEP